LLEQSNFMISNFLDFEIDLFSFNENAFYTEQFVSMNDISTVLNENEYDDAIYILKMITREQ